MFSLQRFLGKEDRFFDLLEASAAEAQTSVRALTSFMKQPDQVKSLDDFIRSRRNEKRITSQISEELCTSFVTALEREDIEALSVALYKIPKTIEKIGERILIAPRFLHGIELSRQLALVEQAVDIVLTMIKELRRNVNLDLIRGHNDRLQTVEGEADKLVVEFLTDLYSGKRDPVQVVFLKDLFELLEKVTD
ncbi:MAG: pit accessory protein, partial [Verrucomicrobiota bacterium]